MSDYTQVFDLTIPAGNGVATPVEYATPVGICDVERILITFPPGCAGLVNACIFAAHSPAYPNLANTYLAYDDYTYDQAVTNQINSGQWSIEAYNLDYFPHLLQVVFMCNLIAQSPTSPATQPISL